MLRVKIDASSSAVAAVLGPVLAVQGGPGWFWDGFGMVLGHECAMMMP